MELTFLKKELKTGYGEVKVMAVYEVAHNNNIYEAHCQIVGIEGGSPEIRVEGVELPTEDIQNEDTLCEDSAIDEIQDFFNYECK